MQTYREFLSQKISYLISHLQKNRILLDHSGTQLKQINLSFQSLCDQYLLHCQQLQQSTPPQPQLASLSLHHSLKINQTDLQIKLTDKDLYNFWKVVNPTYELAFNLENQDVTDESLLKLAQLYHENMCAFSRLKLRGNAKITQIGLIKLGQALRNNASIREINLNGLTIPSNGVNRIIQLIGVTNVESLDLGFITNQSLIYLAKNLENTHSLESISFGQNTADKWTTQGKQVFQKVIRRGQHSKKIISINVSHPDPLKHYQFISELNILIKKNRKSYVDHCQDQFKAASLNPNHTSYYDPDNHNLNAYKFSVKSYLTNVFGSLLDQALYFLEKQRRNQLREEVTFEITKQPVNKIILEDICTSDGSIIVLTKYLLNKIKEKEKDFNNSIS